MGLYVSAQLLSAQPAWPGKGLPERFGRQNTKDSRSMRPKAHDEVSIRVRCGRRTLRPARLVPDVPVWSGISWVAKIYSPKDLQAPRPLTIDVRSTISSANLDIQAFEADFA